MRRSSRNGLATLLVLAATLLAQSATAQKRIIFIENSANQQASDSVVKALLGATGATIGGVAIPGLGYNVILVQQLADAVRYTTADGDMIWVSQSIGSANVKQHTADPIPILTDESALLDTTANAHDPMVRCEMRFGTTGDGTVANAGLWNVVNITHPITSIFPLGNTRMFNTGTAPLSGYFQGAAAGVTVLCTNPTDATQNFLGIADTGATPLGPGGPAGSDPCPARRVCLGLSEDTGQNLTPSGAYLLQRAVQWTIGDPVTAGQVTPTPPAAPSGLTATMSGSGVLLGWTDNSNNETGFKIERKTAATAYVEIAQSPSNSYLDNTVMVGTAYTYHVRATNSAGDSAYSNEVTITPAPAQAGVNRGGWNPTTGGWDVVWEGQHLAADGWLNSPSSGDPGLDGNYRTWADNWDPDDVTTQTIVGGGETEDGINPAANAIVCQLQDNYTASDNGHGRRLKFDLPLPGTYDTRPDNTVRNPELNIVNVNKGVTLLVRFKVVTGTYLEPDTGIGETVFATDIVGLDCSDGDDDRAGLAVGTDRARWTTDTDTKSTPIVVGDLTGAATQARFRTFWIVIEPGRNLNNWQGTLWVDGQVTQIGPTMGGPGDAGPNGTFAGAADGDQSLTEDWFMYADQIETNATANGNATSYPEWAGKAFLVIGPGRTTGMVTWQYDYVCLKLGAHRPTAAPTTPPNPPSNLTAQLFGSGVLLGWTDNANNETGFKLERKTSATAYVEIAQPGQDATSYLDTTVVVGTTYTYRIRAANAIGNSTYSNEVTATALPQLGSQRWILYNK